MKKGRKNQKVWENENKYGQGNRKKENIGLVWFGCPVFIAYQPLLVI